MRTCLKVVGTRVCTVVNNGGGKLFSRVKVNNSHKFAMTKRHICILRDEKQALTAEKVNNLQSGISKLGEGNLCPGLHSGVEKNLGRLDKDLGAIEQRTKDMLDLFAQLKNFRNFSGPFLAKEIEAKLLRYKLGELTKFLIAADDLAKDQKITKDNKAIIKYIPLLKLGKLKTIDNALKIYLERGMIGEGIDNLPDELIKTYSNGLEQIKMDRELIRDKNPRILSIVVQSITKHD